MAWVFARRDCSGSTSWTSAGARIHVTRDKIQAEYAYSTQKQRAMTRLARAPRSLWVAVPPRPQLQGEYLLEEGRTQSFNPVWRQASNGSGRLIGAWDGSTWMLCDGDAKLECGIAEARTCEPSESG